MRPLKAQWLLSILLVLGSLGFSCAPTSPQSRQPLAQWLETTLNNQLAKRCPDNARLEPLSKFPFHFVFLVNTAQAASKSTYIEFVKAGISDFLADQYNLVGPKENGDSNESQFSVYPYQLDLYGAPPDALIAAPLNKDFSTSLADVPFKVETVRSDGTTPYLVGMGSDNSGARADLLAKLGDPSSGKPIIVIQLTANSINEDPKNPTHDAIIRPLPAQTALLDGTGYVAYETPGQPLVTEPPSAGSDGYPVHVWLYGPSTLERNVELPSGTTSSNGFNILVPIFIGVAIIIGLVLLGRNYFNFTFRKKIAVAVDNGSPLILKRGEVIPIWGSGGKRPPNSIEIVRKGVPNSHLFSVERVKEGLKVIGIQWEVDAQASGSSAPIIKQGEEETISFRDSSSGANYTAMISAKECQD